jgi:hypothetical protein
MEQNPPPQLPWHTPELPTRPVVIPMLPTRVRRPGRRAPLPDAVAVRQLAVPDAAPPYDDEMTADPQQIRPDQPQLDQTEPDQTGQDQTGQDQTGQGQGGQDQGAGDVAEDDNWGPQAGRQRRGPPGPEGSPGGTRQSDPAGSWPSQFAQVLAETLAGSRPAQQLTPWTTEQARRRIRQLGPMLATGQRPRVRRVITSAPAIDVIEMTAVIGFGPRIRVLALRLEREQARPYRQGGARWRCTAIESA